MAVSCRSEIRSIGRMSGKATITLSRDEPESAFEPLTNTSHRRNDAGIGCEASDPTGAGVSMSDFLPRMRQIMSALFLMVGCVLTAIGAKAHTVPDSHINLRLGPNGAHAEITAAWSGLTHDIPALGGIENPVTASSATAEQNREAIFRLLKTQFNIEINGQYLTAESGAFDLSEDKKSVRAELFFPWADAAGKLIPPPDSCRVHGLLFPTALRHRTIVSIYRDDKLVREDILTPDDSEVDYKVGATQNRWDVVRQFVREGIHHIFIGPDHICFIVGLLLAGGSVYRLLKIVTAFTVAHSITLALAALGVYNPSPSFVEPAIAFTIVVVGVYSIGALRQESSETAGESQAVSFKHEAHDLRVWFAFSFGLIHGFGFAGALAELELPRWALGWSLFSFNVGVELGQACIVLLIAPALSSIAHSRPTLARNIAYVGSLGVVFAGAYWFVERIWT